jgi:rhodanese-related sulfurtransferase
MESIDAKELKARLSRGDSFSLVMFMDKAAWERGHIKGSIQCASASEAAKRFAKDAAIVGYCSSDACFMSKQALRLLSEQGFTRLTHFDGGLWAWEQAGFELESSSKA